METTINKTIKNTVNDNRSNIFSFIFYDNKTKNDNMKIVNQRAAQKHKRNTGSIKRPDLQVLQKQKTEKTRELNETFFFPNCVLLLF